MAIKRLLDDLYIIPGLVNVYLIETQDGLALLDTGFPGRARAVLDAVRSLEQEPSAVRHIILTHCHPDHIGNAAILKGETGATVWAHPIDAPMIEAGITWRSPMYPSPGLRNRLIVKLLGSRHRRVEAVKVDRLLDDGESPDFAPDMTAIHVPGHCAGQIAFIWRRHGGVLFTADACVNRRGFTLAIATEDRQLAIASCAKLAKLNFDKVCVMHGSPVMTSGDQQFRRTSFV